MLYHGQSSIIIIDVHQMNIEMVTHELIIFDVQEYKFWPQVGFFSSFDDLSTNQVRNLGKSWQQAQYAFRMLMQATNSLRCSMTKAKQYKIIMVRDGSYLCFYWSVFAV